MIPEGQGSGSLALPVAGLVSALEQRGPDGTALAGTFDHKQAVVDRPGFGDQLGQVLDPGQDAEVGGLVDDGLDPVGAALLQYCLMRECLKTTSIFTSVPGENTRVR